MASKLRASTKRLLEPAMVELGFDVRYPHFQRKRDGELHLVNLVHDKWGGGIFLEFAKHPAGDLDTSWGERIPEEKIDVACTDPATRGRLLATREHDDERMNYFRYDAKTADRAFCDTLVQAMVDRLPQITSWFDEGFVGPNISLFSAPNADRRD